jgi:beta-galactosidase GanA
MQNKFIYATGYYPLMQEREDWEKDLLTMKNCGITLIRTAELFNTWDRIAPTPDTFNFGFLDDFFDLCSKYDMQILLGTGTASPPYWVHELYPDVNILNNHNEQYPNNVSYSWACIDNNNFIKEVDRYLTTLVNRYKDHPALHSYQIHNEIAFPFMPLKKGDVDLYCYCDHSRKKFREWITKKYETLDNVNYAYRWGATNTIYTSFDQVEPPKTKCGAWASVTRWLDWRLFWMENMVDFISYQNKLIKKYDTEHLTTTNIFFLKSQDPLGVITALDQFEMAKVVDIVGYDLYPGSGNKLEKYPEFSSMFLDLARSTVKPLNKNYWLLETESGPINGWVLGPSRTVNGDDLYRNIFDAVGKDTKLTLYQGFRQWDFQPLHWGGLVDLDGNETDLTKSAAEIGKILADNTDLIYNSHNKDAEIAILISKENAIILNGMEQEHFLVKAMRGAYRSFTDLYYDVEFITPEQLKTGYAKKYKLIYMPFMSHISTELSLYLEQYVKEGGNLIGTARCGYLGDNGWYNHHIPGLQLLNVFGVEAKNVFADCESKITLNKKTYQGFWHKEILELNSAEVLCRFSDDNPAVTTNSYGEGNAVYFATHPDVAYIENNSELLKDFLIDYLPSINIIKTIDVDYTNQYDKEINAHYLSNEKEALVILTNYVSKSHQDFFVGKEKLVKITLNDKFIKAFDVVENKELAIDIEDNKTIIQTQVRKNKVTIIKLNKGE